YRPRDSRGLYGSWAITAVVNAIRIWSGCGGVGRLGRWVAACPKGTPEGLHLCNIRWCFEAKILTPGGEIRIIVGVMLQQRSPFGQHISDFSTEAREMLRSVVAASTGR